MFSREILILWTASVAVSSAFWVPPKVTSQVQSLHRTSSWISPAAVGRSVTATPVTVRLLAVPEDQTASSRVEILSTNGSSNVTNFADGAAADRNGRHQPQQQEEKHPDNGTNAGPPQMPKVDATEILAIDPTEIDTVPLSKSDMTETETGKDFVSMFRGSANYIANHRKTLAVHHVPGGLLDEGSASGVCRDLMNDIALTWLLGMDIVIVLGCRDQIEQRLPHREYRNGLGITDEAMIRVVKEEAGYVRFEVERQLARALRMHAGQHSHDHHSDGNVVSGNFFSAQPFGILDGVDYKYTGFVRRVEVEKIRQVHDNRDICLLSTLGVSPSGEVFNVNSESLAAQVAVSMKASKIIFFTENQMILKNNNHGGDVPHLRVSDARNFLKHREIKIQKKGIVHLGDEIAKQEPFVKDFLLKIGWGVVALEGGVKRAHIVAPTQGGLLQELYTRDGGRATMISRDLYDGIRRANVNDVAGIYDLILPLINAGTLVERPKSALEKDIDNYYVYTRDNLILACGQLKKFEDGFAEIGCLVVNPQYRAQGRGDAILGYLERMCVLAECKSIFVLSTQTMEWFAERGFERVDVDSLPPSRQATYNWERRSKIYMKRIQDDRDLDAAELWWNR